MSDVLRVLVVEDSELDAKVLEGLLAAGGYTIEADRVETAGQMTDALRDGGWDIILADYNLPDFSAPKTHWHIISLNIECFLRQGPCRTALSTVVTHSRPGHSLSVQSPHLARDL